MVCFVTQSRPVLVQAAVLWRHEDTEVKLLLRVDHVHQSEAVPVPLEPVLLVLDPPVQAAPVLAQVAVVEEAAVEADQVPRPHQPPHEQPLPRPQHTGQPHIHRANLKGVSQVCWQTEAVEVWRTVGQRSVPEFSGLCNLYFSIN